eukprot:scaffold555_cov109-Isochrysis_galbana.AAC.11
MSAAVARVRSGSASQCSSASGDVRSSRLGPPIAAARAWAASPVATPSASAETCCSSKRDDGASKSASARAGSGERRGKGGGDVDERRAVMSGVDNGVETEGGVKAHGAVRRKEW